MSQVDLLDPLVSIQWEKGSVLEQKVVLSVFRAPGLTMLKDTLYVYFSGTRCRMSDDYAVLYCLPSDLSSWVEVCEAPVTLASLSTYHSKIVLVGGLEIDGFRGTDKVWMMQGARGDWDTSLPPMPTKRLLPAVINSGTSESECLIVAGGLIHGQLLNTVEVLKEEQWTKIPPLPYTCKNLNHTIHNGILYLIAGRSGVNTCNLQALVALCNRSDASKPNNLWRYALKNREPAYSSSNMSSSGKHLIQHVADDSGKYFYAYSFGTRSWVMLGETPDTESSVVLPTEELTVLSREVDADANCFVFYAFKGCVKGIYSAIIARARAQVAIQWNLSI